MFYDHNFLSTFFIRLTQRGVCVPPLPLYRLDDLPHANSLATHRGNYLLIMINNNKILSNNVLIWLVRSPGTRTPLGGSGNPYYASETIVPVPSCLESAPSVPLVTVQSKYTVLEPSYPQTFDFYHFQQAAYCMVSARHGRKNYKVTNP